MSEPSAQASVTIAAGCAKGYALITDLPTMATLAEEADAMVWQRGNGAAPGAVFKGHNTNRGKTWTTKCTVTLAEPGLVFAFDVKTASSSRWRTGATTSSPSMAAAG
jgi:hypothetical protein